MQFVGASWCRGAVVAHVIDVEKTVRCEAGVKLHRHQSAVVGGKHFARNIEKHGAIGCRKIRDHRNGAATLDDEQPVGFSGSRYHLYWSVKRYPWKCIGK